MDQIAKMFCDHLTQKIARIVTINARLQLAALHLLMRTMSLVMTVISIMEDHIPKEMVEKIQNASLCLRVIIHIVIIILSP